MSEIRQGLPIEEIINISTEVQAGGTIRAEFGTGLLMTTSNGIAAGGDGKCLRFTNQQQVVETFGTHQIINDSNVWFSANPAPKSLYIGRWANGSVNSTLISGPLPASITETTIEAWTDGSFRILNDDETGVNFDGDTSFADIQSTLATAINNITGISGATVTYSSTTRRFTIDFGSTGEFGYLGTSDTNVGTDLSTNLFFTEALGARYLQGSAAESLTQAVTRCLPLATGGAPSALLVGSDLPATYTINSVDYTVNTEMRQIANSGDFMTSILDTSATALNASDTTSQAASANSGQEASTIVVYSRANAIGTEPAAPRPDIGIMALLSSQNFETPQSLITLTPKVIPTVGTTDITSTQLSVLQDKRTSVYTKIGGIETFMGGYTSKDGVWADSQWWLMWLKNEMERSIFLNMRSAKRFGNALLVDTINEVMERAVNSGGAKPGGSVTLPVIHEIRATTGNQDFNGVLETGYLTWVDPPSGTDRSDRISRFKVWIAPSDAIHTVNGTIILAGG